MVEPATRDRVYEARPDLDTELAARLLALPYFRAATSTEIEASFAAYEASRETGDVGALCRTWAEVASPTRATLPPAMARAYALAGMAPRLLNATVFLDSLRAVLGAGERFRDGLSAPVRALLHTEFPYLERRHEHVPRAPEPALAASFAFPDVFAEYIEWGSLDDSRARWQLAVGVNEVQQCCYSDFAAELFRLPELRRHAERERDLARNYLGHWAPRCTLELWRETIYVLDALNAATFALVCEHLLPAAMAPRRALDRGARRAAWREFVANLDTPQWLMPCAPRPQ